MLLLLFSFFFSSSFTRKTVQVLKESTKCYKTIPIREISPRFECGLRPWSEEESCLLSRAVLEIGLHRTFGRPAFFAGRDTAKTENVHGVRHWRLRLLRRARILAKFAGRKALCGYRALEKSPQLRFTIISQNYFLSTPPMILHRDQKSCDTFAFRCPCM